MRLSIFAILTVVLGLIGMVGAMPQSSQGRGIIFTTISLACRTLLTRTTDIPPSQITDIDVNMHALLPQTVHDALAILEKVDTMPSCNKVATQALLNSCSSLDGADVDEDSGLPMDSDLLVNTEADVYAVRLAFCELADTDFVVPTGCDAFVPTERTMKKKGLRGWLSKNGPSEPMDAFWEYDEATQASVKHCRAALHRTPQSWTSYSSSRRNSVVLCRAARSQIEKDEQAHVAKILAETASNASDSLKHAIKLAQDVDADFKQLTNAIPQFHKDLVAGNQRQREIVEQFWTDLNRVQAGLQDIAADIQSVENDVRGVKGDVSNLGQHVADTAVSAANSIKDNFVTIGEDVEKASEKLEFLSQITAYVTEIVEQKIVNGLYQATHDMKVVNEMMPQIHQSILQSIEFSTERLDAYIEKEKEYYGLVHENRQIIADANLGAMRVNSTIDSLVSTLFGLNLSAVMVWVGWLGQLMALSLVLSLLSFGPWERFGHFSFCGNFFAAAGTGIGKWWCIQRYFHCH
jgi:hypothetical protein